jgi:hypothetical protein
MGLGVTVLFNAPHYLQVMAVAVAPPARTAGGGGGTTCLHGAQPQPQPAAAGNPGPIAW